jgi:hypothetical protein
MTEMADSLAITSHCYVTQQDGGLRQAVRRRLCSVRGDVGGHVALRAVPRDLQEFAAYRDVTVSVSNTGGMNIFVELGEVWR